MSDYSDHAANERTFLAWLRTGIAIVALGLVLEKFNIFLEKFNLFVSSLKSAEGELGKIIRIDRLSGPVGRYEGVVIMVIGLVLMLVGLVRFIRDEQMLNHEEAAKRFPLSPEVAVTIALVFPLAAYCIAIVTF